MSFTVVFPKGFSYVLATITATGFLNVWQVMRVGAARKKSGIAAPQLYAETAQVKESKEAYIYNCAQRAHQNTLESLPHLIFGMLLTGLKYPIVSAGLGGAFILGRILYTINYTSGDAKKRGSGLGGLALMAVPLLLLSSAYVAFEFVRAEVGF